MGNRNITIPFRLNLKKSDEAYLYRQLERYSRYVSRSELIKRILYNYFRHLESRENGSKMERNEGESRPPDTFSIDDLIY
jgi:hypothetical protein